MMPPDFIGIGAQKAATSWLFKILEKHPNIWVSPTKELHYFDIPNKPCSHINQILFKRNGYKKSINRLHYTPLRKIFWVYKYLFKKRTPENYVNLFSPKGEQLGGEITPNYAKMNIDKIKEVYDMSSKVKIIYILRNPIYRDWSALCMVYNNAFNKAIELVPTQEILDRVNNRKGMKHSHYINNLKKWELYYPPNQIFIGFFDEIQEEPQKFLLNLFRFLKLPAVDISIFDSIITKKINSYSKAIPSEVLSAIAKEEYKNIVEINRRFNNQYTTAWLDEAKQILNL